MTKEQYQIDKVQRNVPNWFKKPTQISSRILLKFLELQKINNTIDIEQLEYECDIQQFKTNFAKMIDYTDKNHGKVFEKIDNKIYLWEPTKEFVLNEYKKIKNSPIFHNEIFYPDDIEDNNLFEGTKKQIIVNAYERSSKARKECIEEYGYKCTICQFDFEKIYGETGKNFIHVHHIKPLSEIDEKYKINPIKDLRPVCPNCHAMLHKRRPAYSIKEIKNLIDKKDL